MNDQSSAELAVRYSNIREDNGAHAGNEVEILDITEGIAEAAECGRLYVRAHEKVLRIRRLRRRDRKPYMLEDVVIPLSLFPGLSQASVPSHRIVCWRSSMVCCWERAKSALRLAAPRSRSPAFWR